MQTKPKPNWPCPLCNRKYFSRQAVMDCMEKDQKEAEANKRKLKLIRPTR